jgi:parvulin-like peptidyl-prolyl isomerase
MTVPAAEPAEVKTDWRDITHVNPRRAFILLTAGAVVGLAMAGTALFTAKGTSTLIVPPDAVAMVNQQPISRLDYGAQLRALFVDASAATRTQRRQVLDDMIREELFVQRGKELDVAIFDPEVRGSMVKAVESQAAANAVTTKPSEAELRAYYAAHREKYSSEGTMTLRDLVFPAPVAAAARAALVAAAPADAVLARYGGADSHKVNGEEFYFAAKIHLGDAMFLVARGLKDGAVSEPQALPDGVHLMVMTHNAVPVPYDFETARSQVATDYQAEAIDRYEKADARFLRKRANVLIAKDMK